MTNTVWDVLDGDPAISITGSGLTATVSSVARESGCRAADGKVSGKFYFEVTCNAAGGGNTNIGLVTRGHAWNLMNANDQNGVFCYQSFNIFFNGVNTGISLGGFAAGNVICVATDLDNSRVWIRKNAGNWNNSGTANPATNTGGIDISSINGHPWFPYVGMGSSTTSGFTANFGDTSFSQSVPSGFTSGWPNNSKTSGATYNPSDTGSGITLSNSNFTASAANPTGDAISRSNAAIASGKYYFEFYANLVAGTGTSDTGVGLAKGSATAALVGPSAVDATMIYFNAGSGNGGSVYVNGTRQGALFLLGLVRSGHIIGIAVDMTAGLIWYRKSNGGWNGTGDPVAGTGGFDISALGSLFLLDCVTNGETSNVVSLGTSTVLKMTPPSGFTVGFPLGIYPTDGTISGTSTVTGVGASETAVTGSMSGASVVSGVSSLVQGSVGSISGTSNMLGVSDYSAFGKNVQPSITIIT